MTGEYGWTLEEDTVYEGDLVLIEDDMDLNGHKLTVTGDLVQLSGKLKVNGGQLIVKGDYRMQSREGEEGSYTYGKSSGSLEMSNESDYVRIEGSYLSETSASSTLNAGVMEIKGDVTVSSTYTQHSYVGSGTHKLILSGEQVQTVNISGSSAGTSRVSNLEIQNESEEGVVLNQFLVATGEVSDHGNKVVGTLGITSSTGFTDNYYGGNIHIAQDTTLTKEMTIGGSVSIGSPTVIANIMTIEGSLNISSRAVTLSGNVHVKGDCVQGWSGNLEMSRGSLRVDGNYSIAQGAYYTYLSMTNAEDYLYVKGDVIFYPTYGNSTYLSAGTFEIEGNLMSSGLIYASGSHRFLFSGEEKQKISMSADEYFNIIELQNYSVEGVCSDSVIKRNTLIRNDCRLSYGDTMGECGWTLREDQIYEGDLLLMEETLDLNGYTLTVTGDFIQSAGTININGGELRVEGDYRMQTRSGTGGRYTYGSSTAQLIMQNENDKVMVEGNMVMNTTLPTQDYLTNGTLEIKGSFSQVGGCAYQASKNHTIVFSGKRNQAWATKENTIVGNLVNQSEKRFTINATPTVLGTVKDEKKTIDGNGYIKLHNAGQIVDGTYSGTICIVGDDTLQQNLKIGKLIVPAGSSLCAGSQTVEVKTIEVNGNLQVQNAKIICTENCFVNVEGSLYMQNAGSVLVNGDFRMNSKLNHTGYLTDGTLEIKGHFAQNNYVNFVATQNHTVILSRKFTAKGEKLIQTIAFNQEPGTTRFHKLVLKEPLENYDFQNSPETIADEIVYDIEDLTAPKKLEVLTSTSTATTITLSYDGAEDASGILGYEIYRDGVCVAITNETTYTDIGLMPAMKYRYEVYPFDTFRNLAQESPVLMAETKADTEAPTTPQGLSVFTRTGSCVTLRWNAATDNAGIGSYLVYRNGVLIAQDLEETSYKDSGLKENTAYRYQVVAQDVAGNTSLKSKEVEAVVAMPQITEVTPADYSAIGGERVNLTVKFKNVGNASGNRVKIEYLNKSGEWVMLTPALLSQKTYDASTFYVNYSWNINRLNGDYDIRYTLYDADQNTDEVQVSYHIDKEAPLRPENVKAVTQNGIVSLSWEASASADCTSYKVYRKAAKEEEYTLLDTLHDRYETNYVDQSVEEGKSYMYVLSASDSFENESQCSIPVLITVDRDLEAPVIEEVSPKTGRIHQTTEIVVTASDNRKVKEIHIQYREDEKAEWKELAEQEAVENTAIYAWDTTALKDGVYQLRFTATDQNGNESTQEFVRRYEIDNTGTAKMEWTDHAASATAVRLHWADVIESDFAYFQVEEIREEETIRIATVTEVLGYEVGGLAPNQTYSFQVVGYDNLGNRGIPSEPLTVTTLEDTTAPLIEAVYPAASYYQNTIPLQVRAKDNHAVAKAVFSYSTDGESYEEIALVKAENPAGVCTITKDFDIRKLPEGKLYVKFEVYDVTGNKNAPLAGGEDIIVEYQIDRTAPKKVEGVSADGTNGFVELNWQLSSNEDVSAYRIYRATADTGIFVLIKDNCNTRNFYDTTVEAAQTYIYQISAVDIAGNEGEASKEVFVTVSEDKEIPVITGMSPVNGATVGNTVNLKILAMDNACLSEISLEYLAAQQEQEIWIPLAKTKAQSKSSMAQIDWDTQNLEEGTYHVRAVATDMAGNVSEIYQVSYHVDHTAPQKPDFTAQTGHFQILLTLDANEEEDFGYFEIYRRMIGTENYEKLGQTCQSTYVDEAVIANTVYCYKVAAYDRYGNVSWSEEKDAYADDKDVLAPVAVLPENIVGLEGMELALDGLGSTDNVRITSYRWSMGNGDIVSGAQPVYTYEKAGTYLVTLEVSDAAGNQSQASTTIHIYEKDGRGTTKVKVVDENGAAIPYALIYVQMQGEEALSLKADSYGYVTIAAKVGAYRVAAYATNYLPADLMIQVSEYETKEYTLSLVEDELIVGDLTVRRMTLEEMVDAGVDFSAPENYNRFVFNVTLSFKECPQPVNIEFVGGADMGWYEVNWNMPGNGNVESAESTSNLYFKAVEREVTKEEAIESQEQVPVLVYVRTTQAIEWLKEMYEVELGILNAADSQYVIEDSVAHLNLPEGVSLAKTKSGQSLTQEMGAIRGQERKSASWVIKGDESGSYRISADFEGILMPFGARVNAHFETEEEFRVATGEGLHIYVMPENSAYEGEDYYIQFALVNESGRTFYNFSTSFGGYQTPDYEYTVTDIVTGEKHTQIQENIVVTNPNRVSQSVVVRDGQQLTFAALEPGDVYYGTYVVNFPGTGEQKEDVYFRLVDSLVEVLEGANTGVMVHVEPIGGHINRSYWGQIQVPSLYGDPIDMTSGYFADEMTAFRIAGATELTLDMRYASGMTEAQGQLGYGWYHDYEMWLEQRNGIVYYHASPVASASFVNRNALENSLYGMDTQFGAVLAEGEQYSYGEYFSINNQMKDVKLVRNPDGTYTMTYPNATVHRFDESGRLVGMSDATGLAVSLRYEENRTIIQEELSGKKMYLHYDDGGRLAAITDDYDRKTGFAYDEKGRLIKVTAPNGEGISYTYDEKNRILTEANSLGVFVTNAYDEKGRVIRQSDGMGSVQTLAYEDQKEGGVVIRITDANGASKQAVVDPYGQITKVVNENGGSTEYTYDSKGNLICEKDPYGNCIFKEYDTRGNLVKVTDTGNLTTTMTYDARGNVTSITNADGQTARYTYNSRNQQVTATDFSGAVTTYEYNEAGQLVKQTKQGLGSILYTYENGMPVAVTDYLGNTTRSYYDGTGNLIKRVDALGQETTYTYDRAGRMLRTTDSLGNTTSYTYDCNGNVLTITDAKGSQTTYTYDRAGRQTGVTYPDGSTLSYEYDAMGYTTGVVFADGTKNSYVCDASGNVVTEILADGTKLSYTYDLLNRRVSETDKEGRRVTYSYYPNGNPHKVTYADGTYELYTYNAKWKVAAYTNCAGYTTSYEYDAMGNLVQERDALGNSSRYVYDRYGRLTKATDPNGNSTTYVYDANSNCIQKTDAMGTTVYMEYDALNRMVRAYSRDRSGEEYGIEYSYDALGRVSSVKDELGNQSTMVYDEAGNVTGVTDAMGVTSAVSEYDSMGRVTASTDALGLTTTYRYDKMGNLIQAVEKLNQQEERVTTYSYDTMGRVTSVTDPLAGVTKACYDGHGNLSSVTDANGGTTRYRYDSMGRLLEEITPVGSCYQYTYNAQGLLEELENARGQKTTYTYNAIGRVSTMTDELGTVRYTYDPNGNVLTVTDEQGTIRRKYDALNRITEYTDYRGNTVGYAYDELGNLVALTYPGGEIVRYTYYKNGLLHTVTDASGNVTSYEYDARGNLTHTIRPNGTEEICTYNIAGLLTEQKEVKGEEVLSHYLYTYDGYGNITTMEGTETTDTEEGIHRLLSASMTYDADNRLLTYNGETIRYDGDGNMVYGPVDGVMSELHYDCRNRLTGAGGVTYTYDAENIRIKAETADYTEVYVTDTVSASLSRVLTMTVYEKTEGVTEPTGITTTYLYGQGLISETTEGTCLYHHYNNLGSTMKLTDAEGNVVASYTYGTYGELLSGDDSLTHFLYNGRCGVSTDTNGLYYMRKRYYNPEIKRFVNQDILTGSLSNSQSLNQYSYVQGNPVSYTDPFGLSPMNGLFSNTNFAHNFLGLLSCIPGPVGTLASAADGLVYAVVDKDYSMAALCLIDTLSLGMSKVGTSLLKAKRLTNTAQALLSASHILTNATSFVMCANAIDTSASFMYDKYIVQGQKADSSTAWEVIGVSLSVIGCVTSGRGLSRETRKLGDMLKTDGFLGALKRESGQYGCTVKSAVKGGNYCFIAGTLVHTKDGTRAIEDIELGDYVLAYEEETGETGYKRVVNLFRNTTKELAHVKVAGTEEIICTPGHKFFVEGAWISAGEMKPGDILTLADGTTAEVLSVTVEKLEIPVATYNFEVEDWHTYYVADSGVLVHNQECGDVNTQTVSGTTSAYQSGSGSGRTIPQGFTQKEFDIFSEDVIRFAQNNNLPNGKLMIHGSRAKGTATPTSDIDIILRVDQSTFDAFAAQRLSTIPEGTRLYKTIMKAVGKQKLSVFDISKDFGKNLHNDLIPLSPIKNIDFSIIVEGSPFDKGPFIDIN